MVVCIVVCMIVGYLFGCIQTGYIVGRVNKIDIRDYGSGNSGTTNTLRTLGKTAAIITFLGDAAKGLVAVNLARYVIMPAFGVEGEAYLWLLTGFAVVLGHNFPFYLGFKGGKGIACTTGVILAFHWQMAPLCIGLFIVVVLLTQYVSLGSILLVSVFFIELLLFGQTGHLPVADTYLPEIYVLGGIFTLMAIWRHRANIKRLLSGTENKLNLFKKK